MTKQQAHVARRVAANQCVRCRTKLSPREIGKVKRCFRCRRDETEKAKKRYRLRNRER